MLAKRERIIIALAISVSIIILIVVAILAIADRQPVEQPRTEPYEQRQTSSYSRQHTKTQSPIRGTDEPAKTDSKSAAEPKVNMSSLSKEQSVRTLQDVIGDARTWMPIFLHWYGSRAPDFTLPDIVGQQHKLSDYRGKDVIVVFWATWCGPCIREIPSLKKLQDTVGRDKLAILAITNENPDLVKRFASVERINYTVLLSGQDMPIPYSYINSIPCSFFIDTEGRIKLATEGLLSFIEIKAILQAKR